MKNNTFTLITGATGGLGRAYSYECASNGLNLILTATNQEKLDSLRTELLNIFNIQIITKSCDKPVFGI